MTECKHEHIMVFMYEQTRQEFDTSETDPAGWIDSQEPIDGDYHPIEGECLDCGKELTKQELADLIGTPVIRTPNWKELVVARPKGEGKH